ncbi:MAG: hypothetical protein OEV91_08515, partial [Desulfobulbaceae bacterium]|nr:hypothetical protein [Desulfobulbaceae bacterium]
MPFLGTLENIDIAIANLDLKEGTLKAQFVQAVRSYFPDQESLDAINSISVEDLIRNLWLTDDPKEIQLKRKNLSGLKSSVNKSLKELIAEGKNPDGIIIGRDNTFAIAEEQKDQLIKQLGINPESIHSMRDMLTTFKKFLVNMPQGEGIGDVQNLLEELEETRKLMQTLAAPTREAPPDSGLTAAEIIEATPASSAQMETKTDEESPSLEEVEVIELPAGADLQQEEQMPPEEGLEEIDEEELLEIEVDGLEDLLAEQLATLEAAETLPAEELEGLEEAELVEIEADQLEEVAADGLAGEAGYLEAAAGLPPFEEAP